MHTQLDRPVEMQVLPTNVEKSRLDAFVAKASRSSGIDHPNLIHVYDIDQEQGRYFLIEEAFNGTPLAERVGDLSLDEIATLIHSAFQGLAAAHELGVAHGNVTFDSFHVDENNTLKITGMALTPLIGDLEEVDLFDLHATAAIGKEILTHVSFADSTERVIQLREIYNKIESSPDSVQVRAALNMLDDWLEVQLAEPKHALPDSKAENPGPNTETDSPTLATSEKVSSSTDS